MHKSPTMVHCWWKIVWRSRIFFSLGNPIAYMWKLNQSGRHCCSTQLLRVTSWDGKKQSNLMSESSSSSQGISLKGWGVPADNDVASDSRCGATCLFQASGFLLYFDKSIRSEVWHFQFPPPRFTVSRNHCCPTNRVTASSILSESTLLSIIYFLLCVLYLTCDYIVTHATFLSLFLIFLNPVCP